MNNLCKDIGIFDKLTFGYNAYLKVQLIMKILKQFEFIVGSMQYNYTW